MTEPRCTCSVHANAPSRWCEKHGGRVFARNDALWEIHNDDRFFWRWLLGIHIP